MREFENKEITNGQPTWNGQGEYTAFISDGGGGGGGSYVPPVEPNPTFIPPTIAADNFKTLKISLSSIDVVEFLEDDKSVGFGKSQTLNYSPSLTFGNQKTYRANLTGKKIDNYFVVKIDKKYKKLNPKDDFVLEPYRIALDINPASSIFGGMGGNFGTSGLGNYNNVYGQQFANTYKPDITKIEEIYTEQIVIEEYTINNDGSTSLPTIRTIDSTFGTVNLEFKVNVSGETSNDLPALGLVANYEISFTSNLENELGNILSLNYEIVSTNGTIADSGSILLQDKNTNNRQLTKNILDDGEVNFSIKGNLPAEYVYKGLYYAPAGIAVTTPPGDFSKWKSVPATSGPFKLPANELISGLVVASILEKEIFVATPTISVNQTKFDVQVKDSDTEKSIVIPFTTTNADSVLAYTSTDKYIDVNASDESITLYFQKDFNEVYGTKKIILTPTSNLYGTGERVEILVTFTAINDFPSITEIRFADSIDVPAFSDLNIEYDVEYNSFAASTIDVDLLAKDKSRIPLFKSLIPNGSFKINLRTLADKFKNWNGSDNVTLIFKPYNRAGVEELIGNEYEVVTTISYPLISIDEDILKKSIYDSFIEKLKFIEPEKDSKYLTHLANFGNDEQIIISSFEEDNWTLSKKSKDELGNDFVKPEDVVNSVILKLYNPLPANVSTNSTFWVTKLMSNPLIETVVLNKQDNIECPPLKGPNFSVDIDFVSGKSTTFESLDNLILSSSTASSTQLISSYLSSSLINTDELNIEYVAGSTYLWNNFVHFSSAKERVDNFVYKVQLIENYEQLILSSSTDYTGGNIAYYTSSISSLQEVERQKIKKEKIIQGFDGFEKYLYQSSSMSWPYRGSERDYHLSSSVINWYKDTIVKAEEFDVQNSSWIQNNIPQFIVNNEDNTSLLLFFSMIGHHFDTIYYHTKSIERSRGLGYKSKDISDKLLFDVLKSFNWDAKNLGTDSQLWNYVFGMDSDGNTKETNPAKKRTYEIWRRIINNLPYLLKHKGTRKGVYAIMACYGIPSSNLSILEFGGPEVTEITKSKLVMDNITTAIKFYGQNSGSIKLEWKDTERNRKPDTIECFVKPAYSGDFTIVSGSGWDVKVSGSAGTEYGKIIFNYSGSNAISSSLLPIFNDNFFGIEVSRTSGSVSSSFELNIRQANKERTIFQESVSASILNVSASWDGGNYIYIASGSGYTGSLDEFRLWSTPLDKERFYEHVSFPEMINGNHISASTDDLFFRLDFEYPKNLAASSSLLNVDTNIYFSSSLYRNDLESGSINKGTLIFSENPSASYSASAIGFPSLTAYPYQFEAIDRSVVLEIPDLGASRYSTNKVRFESQELIQDLSSKYRSTKKAFDQSPTDSNRVGLFFSPTKELNIDIAKSFGGLNLDNYIGDPSDFYKSNYKSLDTLRNYYFKRFDGRDIYAYINLIKLYEKSMFDDIKKMLPARVKATTGLLIEPHILERSRIQQNKPTGSSYQQDVVIHYSDTTILTSDNLQYEAIVDGDLSENLLGENNQYESLITETTIDSVFAENNQYESLIDTEESLTQTGDYYQNYVTIDAKLEEPTILTEIDLGLDTYGQTAYETIGFGIYAQSGSAIRTYFDKDGRRVKERIRIQLITEEKEKMITKFAVTSSATGLGDPRGGYISDIKTYTETKLNIQPFSGSTVPAVGGKIVKVVPVHGYLPTHYRNTSDLTRGLQNSFYKGSKNTAATTLDGTPPVETFISNPNTLSINKTGRSTSEPILQVE
jgi:hypothetical protein